MKRTLLAIVIAGAALAAEAQPYGPGPGPGPGAGPGPGPGPGMMRGPRWGNEVTPGWTMMTPDERKAHQEKMRGFKEYGDCQAYMGEHHKQMQDRAREKGRKLPFEGPGPGCEGLKK